MCARVDRTERERKKCDPKICRESKGRFDSNRSSGYFYSFYFLFPQFFLLIDAHTQRQMSGAENRKNGAYEPPKHSSIVTSAVRPYAETRNIFKNIPILMLGRTPMMSRRKFIECANFYVHRKWVFWHSKWSMNHPKFKLIIIHDNYYVRRSFWFKWFTILNFRLNFVSFSTIHWMCLF